MRRSLAKSFLFSSKGKEPRAADTLFSISPLRLPNSQYLADPEQIRGAGFCQIKTLFSTLPSFRSFWSSIWKGHFHHPPVQMQTLITPADGGDVS